MRAMACGKKLDQLGLQVKCQMRPEHGGAHWSRLDDRDGVVFWEQESGGVSIDVRLYGVTLDS